MQKYPYFHLNFQNPDYIYSSSHEGFQVNHLSQHWVTRIPFMLYVNKGTAAKGDVVEK